MKQNLGGVFYFRWWVPDNGYEWCDSAKLDFCSREAQLSPQYLIKRTGMTKRMTRPLEDTPGLFLEFIELQPTLEAILSFANRYGWLGCHVPFVIKGAKDIQEGEGFFRWTEEILVMARVWKVWTILSNKDGRARRYDLQELIRWVPEGDEIRIQNKKIVGRTRPCVTIRFNDSPNNPAVETIADADYISPELYRQWTKGELVEPARAFVLKTVNQKLQGTVSPRLLFHQDSTIHPYLLPHHLLGCLWLQVYKAMAGEHPFARCGECGKWMDVSQHTKRKAYHPKCARTRAQRGWRRRLARQTRRQKAKRTTTKQGGSHGTKRR
jgi:hypothetical protein